MTTGGGASATNPAPARGDSPAAAGTPIIVGSLGTFSGPVGEILKATVDGVAVWIRWINARGGLNGHPVTQIVADDGGDPARHRALVRELVEARKIHAFVYKSEALAGLSGPDPYVVEHRIPVIGTLLTFDWDYNSPLYFPQGPAGETFNIASYFGPASQLLLPQGKKRIGSMVCVESTGCTAPEQVWLREAPRWGFEDVYQSRVSLAQPDFTAECLSARRAGAEILFMGFDDKTASRVSTSCARQNYRPSYLLSVQAASPTMTQNPSLDGMIIGTQTFPWVASDTPAQKEYHEAFNTYFRGKTAVGTHALGWVIGKMFEEGGKGLPATVTRESILQGMWSIRNNDLKGLTVPLSFYPDRGADRHLCWGTVRVQGGRFTLPSGNGMNCRS